jgi:hypothetical protein
MERDSNMNQRNANQTEFGEWTVKQPEGCHYENLNRLLLTQQGANNVTESHTSGRGVWIRAHLHLAAAYGNCAHD